MTGAGSSARTPVSAGLSALGLLLAGLSAAVGLAAASWVVGVAAAAVLTALVLRALPGAGERRFGPADLVTWTRALMTCAVAALTAQSLQGTDVRVALLALTVPALALDAVDGRVARRTGTVSAFGARFDGEVDAFLILVLSVAVAPSVGWWVLSAGLARYAFAVAGWVLPWMRGTLPFRYWRKVVTAAVGIVLAVAVADVLPQPLTVALTAGAVALLAESFGRDVWWLWRRRPQRRSAARARGPVRVVLAGGGTVLAAGLVWFALVAPPRPDRMSVGAFTRIPLEALVVAAVVLALSTRSVATARSHRAVVVGVGVVLGAISLLKVLDLGAFAVLDRPFNVVTDRSELGSGLAFVRDSLGAWAAGGATFGAVLVVVAAVVCLPWAVGRLVAVVSRHRPAAARAVAVLGVAWLVCAAAGLQAAPGEPVAAADTGPFVVAKVRAAAAAYRDQEDFQHALAADAFGPPGSADLSALKGKDVVVAFVESYGRVALDGPGSQPVRTLLEREGARLDHLGYTASSAWLTSPTFGGSSWLAHSTLQSGLPVTDQARYTTLLSSPRTTLTSAFDLAGWRTVAVLPSTRGDWPEGRAFYGFDEVYGRSSLGYAGPRFGFSAMPDQFTLSAFDRLELAAGHHPLMAELELTSSHGPWAPLPTTVDPQVLGDGSVFGPIEADAVSAARLWSDRSAVPGAYTASIVYSLTSLLEFVARHRDDDLVVVMLGDHQPSTVVSGFGGNRDVPVTVIARDPAVLQRISDWGWTPGLRPATSSPLWPMAAFRDRFLTAYSSPTRPGRGQPSVVPAEAPSVAARATGRP